MSAKSQYHEQAKRLQQYLRSKLGGSIVEFATKLSFAQEAVAATHGHRDWNTLSGVTAASSMQATPDSPAQSPRERLTVNCQAMAGRPTARGELGIVTARFGLAGIGKTLRAQADAVALLAAGCSVTVLDYDGSWKHLTRAFSGALLDQPGSLPEGWARAPICTLDLGGVTQNRGGLSEAEAADWVREVLATVVKPRVSVPGALLVVDEFSLQLARAGHSAELMALIADAVRGQGSVWVLGQSRAEFEALARAGIKYDAVEQTTR